jgi:hypothetical protein
MLRGRGYPGNRGSLALLAESYRYHWHVPSRTTLGYGEDVRIDRVAHIARHEIIPQEVEDVLFQPIPGCPRA